MRYVKLFVFLALSIAVVILASNAIILFSTRKYIFKNIDDLPRKYTALILGAKTYDERLSLVLKDRVDAGITLMGSDIVETLLLSGDHGRKDYDEVNNMKKYVQRNAEKIDDARIFMDHAGFDTYDSVYRAKAIFRVDSVVIVTQAFHINRALFIARSIGIDAVGLAVDQSKYSGRLQFSWIVRETLARVKALYDVLLKSKPRYLGEKIPITGDGHKSWD